MGAEIKESRENMSKFRDYKKVVKIIFSVQKKRRQQSACELQPNKNFPIIRTTNIEKHRTRNLSNIVAYIIILVFYALKIGTTDNG